MTRHVSTKNMGLPKFPLFIAGYIVFLCIGASIFRAIEEAEERKYVQELLETKRGFIKGHPCLDIDELENLLHTFQVASKKGIRVTDSVTCWRFQQAIFFVTTLVTTIGYGHITPLTPCGKIFTILFSLTGIPLTLSMFHGLVERILLPSDLMLHWLNYALNQYFSPFVIRLVHLIIVLNIVALFSIVLPAVIFNYMEPEWSYLDSLYYCFVSLTTIGIGDFVPGEAVEFRRSNVSETVYIFGTIFYLFTGIVLLMLVLNVFYNIRELNLDLLYATAHKNNGYLNNEIEEIELDSTSVHS